MSSQHVCLHRAVRFLTALAFGFLLALPPASAASPAVRLQIEIPQAGSLALDLTPFIDEDVDPWDDDLDGRRPPPPPPPTITFGSELSTVVTIDAVSDSVFRLVLRDRDGQAVAVTRGKGAGMPLRLAPALAEGRYLLEVESLNGGNAVYVLTLHRSSSP